MNGDHLRIFLAAARLGALTSLMRRVPAWQQK